MPVNPDSKLEVTAFDWVPDFARGYVRDLRPRWACEEIGLDYAEHLISAINRPADHFLFQPWGQVPVLNDGGIRLFESGAILLHLAEKDARLMPRDPQQRANTLAWLFAAYNSVEPMLFELGNVDIFASEEEWAKLRRPSLIEFIQGRLGRLNDAMGDKHYLDGRIQRRRHRDGDRVARSRRGRTDRRTTAIAGLSRPLPGTPRLPARDGCAACEAFSEEAGPPA
jgi:glutathione S-transferase